MIYVSENTVHILGDQLKNTISIHRAILIPTSRRGCDSEAANKNEHSGKEEPRSDVETGERKDKDDNTYVVDKISRPIGLGPRLWYVAG